MDTEQPQPSPEDSSSVVTIEEAENGLTKFNINIDPDFLVNDLEQENSELRQHNRQLRGMVTALLNELKTAREMLDAAVKAQANRAERRSNGKAQAASKSGRTTQRSSR